MLVNINILFVHNSAMLCCGHIGTYICLGVVYLNTDRTRRYVRPFINVLIRIFQISRCQICHLINVFRARIYSTECSMNVVAKW